MLPGMIITDAFNNIFSREKAQVSMFGACIQHMIIIDCTINYNKANKIYFNGLFRMLTSRYTWHVEVHDTFDGYTNTQNDKAKYLEIKEESLLQKNDYVFFGYAQGTYTK